MELKKKDQEDPYVKNCTKSLINLKENELKLLYIPTASTPLQPNCF